MRSAVFAVLAGTLGTFAAGCGFGESGVAPPLDRIFLPAGMTIDPGGKWLYVVNSNSDLRYNAGTLVAFDLDKAKADREKTWPVCSSGEYLPYDGAPVAGCCQDFFDRTALNCDERPYADAASTVRLGSFGSAARVQRRGDESSNQRRIYVAVRSEPSVTYVDATLADGRVNFRCQSGRKPNDFCDDQHKVRPMPDVEGSLPLPQEPSQLLIDEKLKTMYVGHTLGSISLIDLCPEAPQLVSVRNPIFVQPAEGITSIIPTDLGNADAPLFVTGRRLYVSFNDIQAAEIQTVQLINGGMACTGSPRPLSVVPGEGFYSSAFYSNGRDVRGIVIAQEGKRLYALHRNVGGRENPSAVVAIDRSPDSEGRPLNRAIGLVEVCAGGTELHLNDAGRGPRLYAVCFEAGQIYVVDPEQMTIAGVINAGRGPSNMVFAPGDPTTAYVSGFSDNDVSVVDLLPGSPTENQVVQHIAFPHVRGK